MEKATKEAKKLSYEELENVAQQLSDQAKKLYQQLQEAQLQNMFARLNFLMEVVKLPEVFTGDFYQSCVSEIEEMMTLPKETQEHELAQTNVD